MRRPAKSLRASGTPSRTTAGRSAASRGARRRTPRDGADLPRIRGRKLQRRAEDHALPPAQGARAVTERACLARQHRHGAIGPTNSTSATTPPSSCSCQPAFMISAPRPCRESRGELDPRQAVRSGEVGDRGSDAPSRRVCGGPRRGSPEGRRRWRTRPRTPSSRTRRFEPFRAPGRELARPPPTSSRRRGPRDRREGEDLRRPADPPRRVRGEGSSSRITPRKPAARSADDRSERTAHRNREPMGRRAVQPGVETSGKTVACSARWRNKGRRAQARRARARGPRAKRRSAGLRATRRGAPSPCLAGRLADRAPPRRRGGRRAGGLSRAWQGLGDTGGLRVLDVAPQDRGDTRPEPRRPHVGEAPPRLALDR